MPKIHKKKIIDSDVYTKALERIEHLYSIFDDIVVSFSGGKDSTAMLLCAIDVAKKLNRLPVKVFFYDEEAIHPTTIEYVERVSEMPEVSLDWYCLPVQHRNACSNEQPFWYCWNPEEKDIWVRDLPKNAITTHPRFKFGMSMQDFGKEHFKGLNVCVLQGIRTEESIRRYRVVAMKKEDIYISKPEKGVNFAYPIYDWSSCDVWNLVKVKNADYNKTYDIFNMTKMHNKLLHQRVCPPYGEEPLRGLWIYAECFPDLWHKMIYRVKGAATAARYGNSEMYSSGYKPENTSWRLHIENVIKTYSAETQKDVAKVLNSAITSHRNKTDDPIPDKEAHPVSGLSWKFLSKIVTRGDFKGRVIQMLSNEANARREKMGLTEKEAQQVFGKNK